MNVELTVYKNIFLTFNFYMHSQQVYKIFCLGHELIY